VVAVLVEELDRVLVAVVGLVALVVVGEWSVPDSIDTGLGCQVGEFPES
jgi:hypothetical protein